VTSNKVISAKLQVSRDLHIRVLAGEEWHRNRPRSQNGQKKHTHPFYKHLTPFGVKLPHTSSPQHNELKVPVNGQHFLGIVNSSLITHNS
jgi:hypothetical protein